MHTVFALLCFVVVIHWLIFPYPSGLLHWHCGNLKIAPVPAKQPWFIWINTSCEFIMNDCITTTKQSTTKLCAYFLGYTVCRSWNQCCTVIWYNYIPRIRRIGGCYGFTSKPPAARRPPPAARHPPPAARNGVNAITQKPLDGLFSNLVYTLVVIVSWPD